MTTEDSAKHSSIKTHMVKNMIFECKWTETINAKHINLFSKISHIMIMVTSHHQTYFYWVTFNLCLE